MLSPWPIYTVWVTEIRDIEDNIKCLVLFSRRGMVQSHMLSSLAWQSTTLNEKRCSRVLKAFAACLHDIDEVGMQ